MSRIVVGKSKASSGLLLAGLLLVAGCGSTVQTSGQQGVSAASGANGPADQGLSLPGSGGSPADRQALGGTNDGVTPTGQSSYGGLAAQSSNTGAPGVDRVAGLPVSGRGYDAHHLYIGIAIQENANQQVADAGIGLAVGDPKTQAQAVVDDINGHGGVLGRTLVPIYYNAAGSDPNVDAQSACAQWTQDHHVFAVANGVAEVATPVLYNCLAKADTPFSSIAFDPTLANTYDAYGPYWWAPSIMDWNHLSPILVSGLKSQNYFTGWNTVSGAAGSAPMKLGLLGLDVPSEHRAVTVLTAALRAAGYSISESAYLPNSNDESQVTAAAQSAMLNFAGHSITHVISLGGEALSGMLAANNNGYHPRWAVNSYMAPGSLLEVAVPATELSGALGVGLLPSEDVDSGRDPGDVSPAETHCRQLMQQVNQATSRFALADGYLYCDAILSVVDAAVHSRGFATQDIAEGMLSNTFQSAFTFRAHFATSRHAGAFAVRNLAYVTSCSCFQYTSPLRMTSTR